MNFHWETLLKNLQIRGASYADVRVRHVNYGVMFLNEYHLK